MNENILKEIRENLKIPISNIAEESDKIRILYNNSAIGVLPFYRTEKGVKIDFSNDNKMRLNWSKIVIDNEQLFFEKAKSIVKFISFDITAGSFRTIYVKDNESNNVNLIDCQFIDNQWFLFQLKRI